MVRRFDRPTYVDVWVEISITGGLKIPTQSKQDAATAIVLYSKGELQLQYQYSDTGFTLGVSPSDSPIYTPVNGVLGSIINRDRAMNIESIKLSKNGVDFSEGILELTRMEESVFDIDRISFVDL